MYRYKYLIVYFRDKRDAKERIAAHLPGPNHTAPTLIPILNFCFILLIGVNKSEFLDHIFP